MSAAGIAATERPLPSGIWLVEGRDKDNLPFFAGRPEGRDASWLQACRMNGVSPAEEDEPVSELDEPASELVDGSGI